jgi:hypothetical protein
VRCACRGARLGLDDVGDRLGGAQVELAVEERAAGELAGTRGPRAGVQQRPQRFARDDRTAMDVQLDDVLTGDGARRVHRDREAAIDDRAVDVENLTVRRDPVA